MLDLTNSGGVGEDGHSLFDRFDVVDAQENDHRPTVARDRHSLVSRVDLVDDLGEFGLDFGEGEHS